MELFYILILGIAISFDGFFVGLTYSLRQIEICRTSLLLISGISGLSILITILCGKFIASFLTAELTEYLGGAILVLVGLWVLIQNFRQNFMEGKRHPALEHEVVLISFKIPWLGIVIQILREPVTADFDRSGTINIREAFFLGIALALDAVGAGLGAGLAGAHPVTTPAIVFLFKFLFLSSGSYLGQRIQNYSLLGFSALPGFLLISLGIFKWII